MQRTRLSNVKLTHAREYHWIQHKSAAPQASVIQVTRTTPWTSTVAFTTSMQGRIPHDTETPLLQACSIHQSSVSRR
jgi:hypothetical protein